MAAAGRQVAKQYVNQKGVITEVERTLAAVLTRTYQEPFLTDKVSDNALAELEQIDLLELVKHSRRVWDINDLPDMQVSGTLRSKNS